MLKEGPKEGRRREEAARCMPPTKTLVNIIKYNINYRIFMHYSNTGSRWMMNIEDNIENTVNFEHNFPPQRNNDMHSNFP